MLDKVYTQDELMAQNIITMDYQLNLEPGDFIAVLNLKARARNCLRVFFSFEDGRKIMATAHWWQKYLGLCEIPVGTRLLLHYKENSRKKVFLNAVEQISEQMQQAMEAWLIEGKILYTDSTHLKANANKGKFENVVVKETPKAYLKELDKAVAQDRKKHGKKPLKKQPKETEKTEEEP